MPNPNIVWILLDQCRADVLGCYGHPFVRTPNIDRLAASGVLFDRAYCQNPVCVPSRVSTLSGMYCRQTGVFQNRDAMDPADSLLLRAFLGAGYRTANVGKVHLGITPEAAGFEEHRDIVHDGTPHMRVPENYPADWPWRTFTAPGFPQPVIYATDMCPRERGYCAVGVSEALDILETQGNGPQPLLLRLSLDRPHTPVSSPAPYSTMYAGQALPPDDDEAERSGQPAFLRAYRRDRQWDRFSGEEIRHVRYHYYGLVTHLDHELGRLLDAIDRRRDPGGTIVILSADHGCLLGEHGLYVKGPHDYEETARVPFLLSWPGHLPAGRRVTGFAELVDLLPTLCELCGIPIPGRAVGRSLVPAMLGQSPGREDAYAEQRTEVAEFVAIRTARYAYWRYLDHDAAMLFDMVQDPGQSRNLLSERSAPDPERDAAVRDLEARIMSRQRLS